MSVQVNVGAGSPLLSFSQGWIQETNGQSQCSGSSTYSVQLDAVYFSELVFYWTPTSSYSVSVSLDGGALQTGTGESGAATLSTTLGSHSATLQVSCSNASGCSGQVFGLTEVVFTTQCTSSGTGVNATLDDASSAIIYSGFTSTQKSTSEVADIQQGNFFDSTVSYTPTPGATASFSFDGSALYLFGMTGPGFGTFQVSIDGLITSLNGSTTVDTYGVLLFFITELNDVSHSVVITNGAEGLLFALDYAVAVSPGTSGSSSTVVASVGGSGVESTTPVTASAVFPSSTTGGSSVTDSSGSGSTSAIIGGVLGTLAGLLLLYVFWQYNRYKKAGGEGDLMTALFGKSRRDPPPKKETPLSTFKPWAYLKYQPKYATEE